VDVPIYQLVLAFLIMILYGILPLKNLRFNVSTNKGN